MTKYDIEVIEFNEELNGWTVEADGVELEVGTSADTQHQVELNAAQGLYDDIIAEFLDI